MIAEIKSWFEFLVYLVAGNPALKDALQLYVCGCLLGVYWTQGLKRAQRKRQWGGRGYLTSFELRMLSGGISAAVISVMGFAFYPDMPMRELVAHALLGGMASPMLVWAAFKVLGALAVKFPAVAEYLERLKTGDRRRTENPQPPPGVPERRSAPDPGDETGEFWNNDIRR